jgi:hypothetical protein
MKAGTEVAGEQRGFPVSRAVIAQPEALKLRAFRAGDDSSPVTNDVFRQFAIAHGSEKIRLLLRLPVSRSESARSRTQP